ncbi:putative piwi-domain-containing protein [Phytophthora infestans]|uniref:Putative piwi-domain-containing protein n=1 Tax=Phytophthora infestans TaxID=4787 RepID=A0A8S9UD64_PHYIN|nr:putative piwi-domain-containing protein [Phytophthora infestans]
MVRDDEMPSVLEMGVRTVAVAFKMISDGYKPLVTFIVVNKRHQARAFPVNPRDETRRAM